MSKKRINKSVVESKEVLLKENKEDILLNIKRINAVYQYDIEKKIYKRIVGIILKKGKKKKYIKVFNECLKLMKENYFIEPMKLIKISILKEIKVIKLKELIKRKRTIIIAKVVPAHFRFKRALKSIIKNKENEKKNYVYSVNLLLMLSEKIPKIKKKLKGVRIRRYIRFLFKRKIKKEKKKSRKRKNFKRKYKTRKIKVIKRIKNKESNKNKNFYN